MHELALHEYAVRIIIVHHRTNSPNSTGLCPTPLCCQILGSCGPVPVHMLLNYSLGLRGKAVHAMDTLSWAKATWDAFCMKIAA